MRREGRPVWETSWESAAPAVFGSEYVGFETEDIAETIYVPCERVGPQDREARIELRQDDKERRVMLAYSSLDELVACCGDAQPWVAIRIDRMSHVQADVGAEQVLWGVELPDELRRQQHTGGET